MRTLIAIPCMDMVQTSFAKSVLGLIKVEDTAISFLASSLIYDSRNNLCKQAVTEGFDRVLWLDSDMVFAPDLLVKLSADMDEGREFVTGLYVKRKPPFTPVIYKKLGYYQDTETNIINVDINAYEDYPKDDIFKIAACGFGGCMVSTNLINRVGDTFGLPFSPALGIGEDLSFCMRVSRLGVDMYCDSRVKLGHVGLGTFTEDTYLSFNGGT